MIGRLSTIITTVKDYVYGRTPLRYLRYIMIMFALLLFWLTSDDAAVALVSSAF